MKSDRKDVHADTDVSPVGDDLQRGARRARQRKSRATSPPAHSNRRRRGHLGAEKRSRRSLGCVARAAAALLAVSVGIAACRSGRPPVVPWDDAAAAATQPSWAANGPACGSGDVRLSGGRHNGATGTITVGLTATNTSRHPCLLSGYPTGVVTSPSATQPIPLKGDDFFDDRLSPPGDMAPGESSSFILSFPDMCDETPSPELQPGTIHLELPGGTAELAISDLSFGCGLFVSPWRLDKPAPPLPFRASLKVPSSVSRGSTLRYQVRLTNTGSAAIDLRQYCPIYVVDFPSVGTLGRLNCGAAPSVTPGHTVVFEMRINLDPSTRRGSQQLTWGLLVEGRTTATSQFTVK